MFGAVSPAKRVTVRWDLDKTYLHTEFDSFRGLARIPFESAQDKVSAPGVAALIRGLRATARRRDITLRVLFLSASPPQLGKVILEKLAMDGIEHDGITFKDQWQRIRRGKFRDIREQVGYKLTELLRDGRNEKSGTAEYLFGDDWESDPLIYSLYADVVAGSLDRAALRSLLTRLSVDRELAALACELAANIQREGAVRRIFINLPRRSPLRRFRPYGLRVVPTFNYLQTAACLYEDGLLDFTAFSDVVADLRTAHAYGAVRLVNSLRDIERRGHLSRAGASELASRLHRSGLLPEYAVRRSRMRDVWARFRAALRRQGVLSQAMPAQGGGVDYKALVPDAGEEIQ